MSDDADLIRGDALLEQARAIAAQPDTAAKQCSLGKLSKKQGRLREAEACFRRAIDLQPDSAVPYYFLGNSLYQDRPLEAEACFRRAIELQPDFAAAHCNLGSLLGRGRRVSEEQACYRRAIELNPDLAEAHSNLGRTLRRQGKFSEAEACHRRALELKTDLAEVHYNLGEDLDDQGRLGEAEACYQQALKLNPELAAAHCKLGKVFGKQGMLPQAEACYRAAIVRKPDFVDAIYALANLLDADGRHGDAAACYRRVIELKPDSAHAYTNLGSALNAQGALSEEELCYRRAIELKPDLSVAHANLGKALKQQGRLAEAKTSYQQAIEFKPDFAEAHCNLGTLHLEQGELAQAEACYRRSLAIMPDFAVAYSNLLFCLSHSPEINAADLFAEHRKFGEHFEKPLRQEWVGHANSRDPHRALNVGFVSADLRDHPVAILTEPILSHVARCPRLALHAFVNQVVEDRITARLRQHFRRWHQVVHLSEAALSEKIRQEGIDILIDLSGHTANNRLLTFARKPAPIQVSWLGYMGSTGLTSMDYYLGDRYMLPIELLHTQFTEQLVHLPAITSFLPSEDAPPINRLPALENGYTTFGSFNRASKLNRGSIGLWAQLLRALPEARMILGNMRAQSEVDMVLMWFEHAGVARERLTFRPACDRKDYLKMHHGVDICLDTLPFTGFTTTLHAMWMGVPTLTLTGGTVTGRQSTAMLSHVGLEAFISRDKAEFVDRGIALAATPAVVADLRSTLRERMNASPIGQPEKVAAGFLEVLRTMWTRWCAGLPPTSL
jgi:protein O-GlcNAc transferase